MDQLNKYAKKQNKLQIIELTAEQNKNGKSYVSCLSKFYDVIGEDLIKKQLRQNNKRVK